MSILEKMTLFLISLLIVDQTDNAEYFLYKFNISKKINKELKVLINFIEKITSKNLLKIT